MADIPLGELVPPGLGSIVPGEDNTYRVNAAIWNLNRQPKPAKALVRGTVTVDGTLASGTLWLKGGTPVVPGTKAAEGATRFDLKDLTSICVKQEHAGAGFAWMTDRGPDLDYTAQNNRAHWRYVNPNDCGVCGLTFTGTHDWTKPNRSPNEGTERNIWEGQTGIAFVGGKDSKAVGNTVRFVWGDGMAVAAYSPTGRAQDVRQSDGHTYWNNVVERTGRVGLLMNGTKNFTSDGMDGRAIVSSFYHVEIATNPNLRQSNLHLVRGIWRGGNGRFVTMTSGTGMADVFIEDNELIGKPLGFQIAAKGDAADERFARFTIARNVSDTVCTAAEIITGWRIDGFNVLNNVSSRSARTKLFDADAKASCTNVVEAGNRLPIVA